jgi:ADP-ribosylglycohydrolase
MVARRAHLLENTLLSGINVGGDADTTGAMMGAMLGALHGWAAFPSEWQKGLEAADRLSEEARGLSEVLG